MEPRGSIWLANPADSLAAAGRSAPLNAAILFFALAIRSQGSQAGGVRAIWGWSEYPSRLAPQTQTPIVEFGFETPGGSGWL